MTDSTRLTIGCCATPQRTSEAGPLTQAWAEVAVRMGSKAAHLYPPLSLGWAPPRKTLRVPCAFALG